LEELLVSGLAQRDAPAKLLIEKGLITQEESIQNPTTQHLNVRQLQNLS
jgi:hypothetical protein